MPGRGKKPQVQPEKYRDWLNRSEEGQSVPHIAKADGFDVRTVRKYLELARQEREVRDARSMVLRQALEKHYADLVKFATKLEEGVTFPTQFPLWGKGERLYQALRQHLPRSPLWSGLDRWDRLQEQRLELERHAAARMIEKTEAHGSPEFATEGHPHGFNRDGLSLLAVLWLKEVVKALEHPPAPWDISAERSDTGLVRLVCNAGLCAIVSPDREAEAVSFIQELLADIPVWPEAEPMRHTVSELDRVTAMLSEELATLRLRRVVPGRCKYCPF